MASLAGHALGLRQRRSSRALPCEPGDAFVQTGPVSCSARAASSSVL